MFKRFCDNCNREIPEKYGTLRTSKGVDVNRNLIRFSISSYKSRNTELIPLDQGSGETVATLLICRKCAGKILAGMAARISESHLSDKAEIDELVDEYLEDADVLSEEEQEKERPAG